MDEVMWCFFFSRPNVLVESLAVRLEPRSRTCSVCTSPESLVVDDLVRPVISWTSPVCMALSRWGHASIRIDRRLVLSMDDRVCTWRGRLRMRQFDLVGRLGTCPIRLGLARIDSVRGFRCVGPVRCCSRDSSWLFDEWTLTNKQTNKILD